MTPPTHTLTRLQLLSRQRYSLAVYCAILAHMALAFWETNEAAVLLSSSRQATAFLIVESICVAVYLFDSILYVIASFARCSWHAVGWWYGPSRGTSP